MNRKIWKALGIAVCMLALAAPRAMAKTYEVKTGDKFAEAVQEINNKSSDTENEIVLCDDIELTSGQMLTRGQTTIKSKDKDHKISIKGKNAGITVTGEKTVLNLGANGYDKKLTIEEDTRDGSASENPRVAFITVSGGATANMYENVTLQNGMFGGNACVVIMGSDPVTGSKSVFNMHGGVIEKCSRAVMADSGTTFNMSGGEIRNCGGGRGSGNGGGVRVYEATFVMSDGTISGCSADTGGGLCAEKSSTVTINNGTISGCTADAGGGLYADHSTININNGTISGCEGRWGGGLYATNSSKITITGGTISECTAGMGAGGGLYATNSSEITISGSTISECKASLGAGGGLYATNGSIINIDRGTISGCEAGAGGGLFADNSAITINKGTISGCSATINNGGGLYATNSSKITISDGIISGCEGVLGCGLYATNSSEITISGGTISGCTGLRGGGLYANNSTVTITGGVISGCKKIGAGGGLFVVGSTLNIKDGIISECTVSDTGKGGGLYAENSTITISGGTIKDNEAAHGGGVALTNSTVTDEEPIRNWMVVGNKAYKTGGGIWLGEKVEWDISDRTKQIYNNQAIEQGADIFLEGGTSAIKLPNAANMGAKYHDSGINIDNWYNDNPRYTPSESGAVVEANKWLNGGLSLVASYKADPVRIEIDANGGKGGSSSQTVQKGTTVTLEAPTKEGHLFTGWKDEKGNSYPAGEDGKVNITVNENMTLTAEWKKLPSAENLPKTGDESPVLLWGAALAVSAAACFMLRRRK